MIMGYKYSCVIDSNSRYKNFVLVLLKETEDKEIIEEIQGYQLEEGDSVIDTSPPRIKINAGDFGFIIPEWDPNNNIWDEGATAEEINNWESLHPDPNTKTLEEKKREKEYEISYSCNAAIINGVNVETENGTEHFSLQETDQINLTTAYNAVQSGLSSYPYHADGKLCRMFTAAEISTISKASIAHKLYHTTLCNHLLTWIRRIDTVEELQSVVYSPDVLPSDLADNMTSILEQSSSIEEV